MSVSQAEDRKRVLAGLGVAAMVVALGGVFVAAALAPWFSPFLNALSELGSVGMPTAPIFNGALMVGGALGAGFVVAVWAETENPIHAAGLVVLSLAMVSLALVGVFPLPSTMHFVVAPAFFGFATLGVAVFAAGDFVGTGGFRRGGHPARGGTLILLVTVHVVSWVWWFLLGWPGPGVAVPELVGSAMLAVWALWAAADLWPGDPDVRPL
jgi:hypothetical membrane protein